MAVAVKLSAPVAAVQIAEQHMSHGFHLTLLGRPWKRQPFNHSSMGAKFTSSKPRLQHSAFKPGRHDMLDVLLPLLLRRGPFWSDADIKSGAARCSNINLFCVKKSAMPPASSGAGPHTD